MSKDRKRGEQCPRIEKEENNVQQLHVPSHTMSPLKLSTNNKTK